MLVIDKRLLKPSTEQEIVENFNRILILIDKMQSKIDELEGRIETLEV